MLYLQCQVTEDHWQGKVLQITGTRMKLIPSPFRIIHFGKDYVDGLKEGISTRKKCKKVFFRGRDIRNYWQIQKELWENTITYIIELAKRKL